MSYAGMGIIIFLLFSYNRWQYRWEFQCSIIIWFNPS